jgi:hypothetical protein
MAYREESRAYISVIPTVIMTKRLLELSSDIHCQHWQLDVSWFTHWQHWNPDMRCFYSGKGATGGGFGPKRKKFLTPPSPRKGTLILSQRTEWHAKVTAADKERNRLESVVCKMAARGKYH